MTAGGRTPGAAPVDVGPVAAVPEGACVAVLDGQVLLTRTGERVVGYENRCQHRDAPLDGGLVRHGVVTCPRHFWRYDLASGRNLATGEPLVRVPVTVEGGRVLVVAPAASPARLRDVLREHARTWQREAPPA